MKKAFLVLFSLFSFLSFAQSVNDYEFVMVPIKFEFQRDENEYRLNTLLKYRLEEYGFQAFYTSDQLNTNYNDRCRYLNVNVVNESGLFTTKLYITFKDCNNAIVYQSVTGTSKTKDRKKAYTEALEEALTSVKTLKYKFTGKKTESIVEVSKPVLVTETAVAKTELVNENSLFAQPITNGFQLVDTTPKVVLKMFRTSQPDYYTATSADKSGVVFKKNNEWFFEYYQNDQLISEKLNIKF